MPRKPSRIEVRDGLLLVTANNTGRIFVFDNKLELLEQLRGKAWNEHVKGGYLFTMQRQGGVDSGIYVHHLVLPKREGVVVDHRDRQPWNNRRANLRYLSIAANVFNGNLKRNNTSGHPGVSWSSERRKWQVHITVNRKQIALGRFNSFEVALAARLTAEDKYYPGVRAIGG